MKYVCGICGWEYDEEAGLPEAGIAPGTKWARISSVPCAAWIRTSSPKHNPKGCCNRNSPFA